VQLGWAETNTDLSKKDVEKLNENLQKIGFEILDASLKLIESKKLILEKVQNLDIDEDFLFLNSFQSNSTKNTAVFLKIFSNRKHYFRTIFYSSKNRKSKRTFDLRELTLSQIADKLGYKTVQHLSQQFKKTTGFSPSQFQELKEKKRLPIDFI
jgi:AraC-like DNA-binding protein